MGSEGTLGLSRALRLKLGHFESEPDGHNPVVVLEDADLDRAVEASYAGAFWSAGQKCTATSRASIVGILLTIFGPQVHFERVAP